jgi:S-adenosylmethionine-diacylglycerol 3-amino-3-carboxypropyl transferase
MSTVTMPAAATARWRDQGALRSRLFRLVYDRSLIYNQCWEDPAVDRLALELSPRDRVFVITSAGCNALDYALCGCRVVAVDANARQSHLLELKLAGIRTLAFDEFFRLFGDGATEQARELYARARPHLSPLAREFWDLEIRRFLPAEAPGGSFYFGGTSGRVAFALRLYVDHVARVREGVDAMLAASTVEEQLSAYRERVRPALVSGVLLNVLGSAGVLSLLGVPGPQRRLVAGHEGGFGGFVRDRLDATMSRGLLRENYFWRLYIEGRYRREGCPEYLTQEGFERLRGGLVDNVSSETGTVTSYLAEDDEGFSAFVLLDHMDWLASTPALIEEEWEQILRRAAPGARVIFRSAAQDESFLPSSVRRRLSFDPDRASKLHARDRVGTYGSFHIARLRAD